MVETEKKSKSVLSKLFFMGGMGLCFAGGAVYQLGHLSLTQKEIYKDQWNLYNLSLNSREATHYNFHLRVKIRRFASDNGFKPTPRDILDLMVAQRNEWITSFLPCNPNDWSPEQKELDVYAKNMIDVWAKQNNLGNGVVSHRSGEACTRKVLNDNSVNSR